MTLYPINDPAAPRPKHRYPQQRAKATTKPRQGYDSDLTDAQWELLKPLLTPPARRGRPPAHDPRAIINAILYLTTNGCAWRALPRDLPPHATVYWWFRRWRDDHTLAQAHNRLRDQCRARAGRDPQPTAAIIDSQSIRAADTVSRDTRGFDVAKKTNGRKRHIIVDTNGLLLQIMVTPASTNDRTIVFNLLWRTRLHHRKLTCLWADGGYTGKIVKDSRDLLGITTHIVRRDKTLTTFKVLPRRWVVERTFAWISKKRRCVRDYERLPVTHAAFVTIAMISLMLNRLTRPQRQLAQATA